MLGVSQVRVTLAKSALKGAIRFGFAVVGFLAANFCTSAIKLAAGRFQGAAENVAGSTFWTREPAGFVSARA